jgi:hypothetical protein
METAEPKSKLTPVAQEFFAAAGKNFSDVTELLTLAADDSAMQAIQQGINAANKKAISRAQVIQKWAILPRDFSIVGGELGLCFDYLQHKCSICALIETIFNSSRVNSIAQVSPCQT